MTDFTTISELARQLRCRPRDISDLFYCRALDDSRCPIVSGRRLIPSDYVSDVKRVLAERGKVSSEASE